MLSGMRAGLELVIPGNHDIDLDHDFYTRHGGRIEDHEQIKALWSSPETRAHGIVLLPEGTHTFTLDNGAALCLHTSPHTPQYGESAFQYPTGQDRYNKQGTPAWAENMATKQSTIPSFPAVDILMTHGPPKHILDDCADGSSGGCEHLGRAVARCKPMLHCFGHIHRGWGARRGFHEESASDPDEVTLASPEFIGKNQTKRKGYATINTEDLRHGEQTLFVNAAIMDDKGEPCNAPWLVKLDLKKADIGRYE